MCTQMFFEYYQILASECTCMTSSLNLIIYFDMYILIFLVFDLIYHLHFVVKLGIPVISGLFCPFIMCIVLGMSFVF